MDPLLFEPYLRPQIWGGRQLAERLHKSLPATGTFGESWEVSGHPHHVSRIAEGKLLGLTLTDLCRLHAAELYGDRQPPCRFPLLVKYLDCHLQLSVQVHPSDTKAQELLGEELGKTEVWVVLDVGPEGRIYAGLQEGTTPESLARHLDAGTVAECLHSFVPRPGDCVFLPAGTVHAVGGGVLIAEVQQSSDATFRLFDWNRVGADGQPRKLHRKESLAAIDWRAGEVSPVQGTPLADPPAGVTATRLVSCDYFSLDRYQSTSAFEADATGTLAVWMVIAGEVELSTEGYRRLLRMGDTVLIPAVSSALKWTPAADLPVTLLAAHLV